MNSLLEFEPTASGQYFLSAGASGSGTGSYTLSAAEATALLSQLSAPADEVPPVA